jgi:glycosyltransferase involved in cell wall biosynthesis
MIRHTSWDAYPIPGNLPPVVINDPSLPLVSIVTPSYDQGRFIRETIESVLTQDYPNIEYWVIDGGSTDETISVLEEYEHDPRFHWISEKDEGQSDAINKGWSKCRGEIVAWLNSDDIYLPGAMRAQVSALLRHRECGIVYGDVLYVGQNGESIYKCYGRPYSVVELLRLSIPAQPTTFVRRRICEEIGPLDRRFRYSMDSEYWVRASKVTDVWYEARCIATYRLHDTSKTIANHSGFYEEWIAIAETFFSDPDISEVHKEQKPQVFADIYSRIAMIEAEQGSLSGASHYLFKAWEEGGCRVRMLKLPALLVEQCLPFRITPRLIRWWTYLQSRRTVPKS